MVSNSSTIGADLGQAGQALADGARAVGESLGLVAGDVIPGDPAHMASVAEHLTTLGGGFERAGTGFKSIDDGGWTGQAAERFLKGRDKVKEVGKPSPEKTAESVKEDVEWLKGQRR